MHSAWMLNVVPTFRSGIRKGVIADDDDVDEMGENACEQILSSDFNDSVLKFSDRLQAFSFENTKVPKMAHAAIRRGAMHRGPAMRGRPQEVLCSVFSVV